MNNVLITVFTLLLLHVVQGGPFQKRTRREIYPEIEPEKVEDVQPQVCVVGDLVYGAEEMVPSEQPCLKCKCQPPGVHCEATRCQKKPGCRAIHKPNTCCPDYQCECEHEGKTYTNGERLEQKPGTECKVCYCRGGEVQCADLSCYIRNDCEGRNVPGKCCPKYDHCPPKEPFLDRTVYTQDQSNVSSSKESASIPETNEISEIDNITEVTKVDKAVQTGEDEIQKITIHEIIPEIKEIPITNSPKREITDSVQGQLLVEEAQDVPSTQMSADGKLTTENNELDLPDTESDSSEVAEIYQQPPPVLRIGDKLLFLKKGEFVSEKGASTPSTVITIIGAEGLQRGFEDSVENHELIMPKHDGENRTQEDELDSTQQAESTRVLTLVERPTTKIPDELKEASLIPEGPTGEATTEAATTQTSSVSPAPELTDDAYYTNSTIEIAVELPAFEPNNTDFEMEKTMELTTELSTSTTTELPHTIHPKLTTEKEEIQELNPEYPPIPDIMSSPDDTSDHEMEQSAKREIEIEAKILPEVLPIRSNKSVPQNASNSEWLKHTLINTDATLPDSILKEVAASDLEDFDETTSTAAPKTLSKSSEGNEKFGITIESTQFTKNHIKALTEENTEDILSPSPMEKSVESLELTTQDSGESVTDPTAQSSAALVNEDASVEGTQVPEDLNKSDFVEMLPGVEKESRSELDTSIEVISTTENSDVEMIDIDLLRGHTDKEEKNATHEDNHPAKVVSKRENDESSKIFDELDREIGLISGDITDGKSKEEEEKEAHQIFRELLEDYSTTAKPSVQPRDKEGAVLQRVSDAIAKFQLRDTKQSLDTSILSILRDFFSTQYRAYSRK